MDQDLVKEVVEVLQKHQESSARQAEQINAAMRLVDDLVSRGLAEPASYKLAPNSVPALSLIASPIR